MPELPDVEAYRHTLVSGGLHRRIEKVHVPDQRPLDISPATLRRHLQGKRLETARRHGKWLLAEVEGGEGWLAMHFGMTGTLERIGGSDEEVPKYTRLLLDLDDGARLAFTSRRLLGKVELAKGPEEFSEQHHLGPDALAISKSDFVERFGAKGGTVKAALMDQKTLAGLGNVYTDEILFQARVHPKTPIDTLDEKALGRLYERMQHVLKQANKKGADPKRFPRTWLTPHRGKAAAECPRCGARLQRGQVSGRTTYWCPRES